MSIPAPRTAWTRHGDIRIDEPSRARTAIRRCNVDDRNSAPDFSTKAAVLHRVRGSAIRGDRPMSLRFELGLGPFAAHMGDAGSSAVEAIASGVRSVKIGRAMTSFQIMEKARPAVIGGSILGLLRRGHCGPLTASCAPDTTPCGDRPSKRAHASRAQPRYVGDLGSADRPVGKHRCLWRGRQPPSRT